MNAADWLKENTFRCAIGRVSPKTCEALRARPVFNPDRPLSGPYRPKECMECKEWREKMVQPEHDVDMGTKRCSKCGQTKPLEEFHREKKSPDGRRYICKECSKLYARARQKAKKRAKADPALDTQPQQTVVREPLRCFLCRCRLDWYDGEQDIGFVTEHYILPPEGRICCIVCFSRFYGMRGFKEDQGHEKGGA